jgi:hypothetical protein
LIGREGIADCLQRRIAASHRHRRLVAQELRLAAIDVSARPAKVHVVGLVRKSCPEQQAFISLPQRYELFLPEERHRDRRALPGCRVLDDDEPVYGDPAFDTVLDRELLRRELHHV